MASSKNFTMTGGTLNLALGSSFSQITGGGTGVFSISGGTVAFDTTGAGFSYGSTYQVASGFASYAVSGVSYSGYDSVNYTNYQVGLDFRAVGRALCPPGFRVVAGVKPAPQPLTA